MIMSGMLSRARAQLGRVTGLVHARYPSPNSVTMFKQRSSTSYPPFSENDTLIQFWRVARWIGPCSLPTTPFKLPSLESFLPTRNEHRLAKWWYNNHYLFHVSQRLRDQPYYDKHMIEKQFEPLRLWAQTYHAKQCSSPGDTLLPSLENQKKLLEHVVHLTCQSSAGLGYCEVFLVGMNYGSQRSRSEVQAIINHLKPEAVFLELSACELEKAGLHEEKLGIENRDIRVVYKEALKCGGTVVPRDRPIEITQERVWRKMPFSERIKLFYNSYRIDEGLRLNHLVKKLEKELESGGHIDIEIITLVNQKLHEISPTFFETYIHERDLYMSAALLEEAKKRRCIVAVVGMSHLPGIIKHWKQPISVTTLQDLLTVPPIPIYFRCAKKLKMLGCF